MSTITKLFNVFLMSEHFVRAALKCFDNSVEFVTFVYEFSVIVFHKSTLGCVCNFPAHYFHRLTRTSVMLLFPLLRSPDPWGMSRLGRRVAVTSQTDTKQFARLGATREVVLNMSPSSSQTRDQPHFTCHNI